MGNNNNKAVLRRAQSMPDSQFLENSASSPRGLFTRGKLRGSGQGKLRSSGRGLFKFGSARDLKRPFDTSLPVTADNPDAVTSPQKAVPLVEALFLPEFPVKHDYEKHEFEVIEIIARGAFGNVLKIHKDDDKEYYAMKVLDKTQIIIEGAVQQCKDEAAIQYMLGDHPFVVKTNQYWQSQKHLYIVLDYVAYGEMFTMWTYYGTFPEIIVKHFVAELAIVIDYLQKAGVIYRDLKMENILFDVHGHIQLTDFGLAKWLQIGEKTRTVCGTLQYMAPEILAMYPYTHAIDWWSLGILMYAMLVGTYPVEGGQDHLEMAKMVFACDYKIPNHISQHAQEAVHRLLAKSPMRRLADLFSLQHLAFFSHLSFTELIDRKVSPCDVVPVDYFSLAMTQSEKVDGMLNGDVQFSDFEWNLPNDTIATYI